MNRSVVRLLGASVLAPAAALAFAASPALAASGTTTTLLYDVYAQTEPVTRHLPASVTGTAGSTAEQATRTVDGLLGDSPGRTDVRTVRTGHPVKTTPRPSGAGDTSGIGVLPGGGSLGDLNALISGGTAPIKSVPGQGRLAEPPVSIALTDLSSTLGKAAPAGLPAGVELVSPAGRSARPVPTDDVLGQASALVDDAGAALDAPENKVGEVVSVLKSNERGAKPSNGPISLLDSSQAGLPGLPGVPGLG